MRISLQDNSNKLQDNSNKFNHNVYFQNSGGVTKCLTQIFSYWASKQSKH